MRTQFWAALIPATALIIWITGCTKPNALADRETPHVISVPESYMITTGNRIDYQPGLECAAFSSAYLLRHFGEEAAGLALFETFPDKASDGGVMPYGIETFFNDYGGYEADFKCGGTVDEIKALVSGGTPVIVFIHVAEPYESTHNTHYIPVIGYDEDYLYFAESLTEFANCKEETGAAYNRKTDIAKFERLWVNIDGAFDQPYFEITKN